MLLRGTAATILRNWILAVDSLPLKGRASGSIDTRGRFEDNSKGVRVAADAARQLGVPRQPRTHKGDEEEEGEEEGEEKERMALVRESSEGSPYPAAD